MQETWRDVGSIPGSGRSPGDAMATHSSILAWRIPWTEEPGGQQSLASQSQTWLKQQQAHTTAQSWASLCPHCLQFIGVCVVSGWSGMWLGFWRSHSCSFTDKRSALLSESLAFPILLPVALSFMNITPESTPLILNSVSASASREVRLIH